MAMKRRWVFAFRGLATLAAVAGAVAHAGPYSGETDGDSRAGMMMMHAPMMGMMQRGEVMAGPMMGMMDHRAGGDMSVMMKRCREMMESGATPRHRKPPENGQERAKPEDQG